jgi:hypothetical protein
MTVDGFRPASLQRFRALHFVGTTVRNATQGPAGAGRKAFQEMS